MCPGTLRGAGTKRATRGCALRAYPRLISFTPPGCVCSLRCPRSHDAVVMHRANDAVLAAVMSSPVIVDLNARIEPEVFDQAISIENRIEIDPGTTVVR